MISREVCWDLNESLLQSYRSVFIASQSLLISAVGNTLEHHTLLSLLIIIIAMLQLGFGCSIIDAKAKIVDYYKFNLEGYCSSGYYVKNREFRSALNLIKNIENWRPTRVKFDIYIPITFMVIWFAFLLKLIIMRCQNISISYELFLIFNYDVSFRCFAPETKPEIYFDDQ